MQQSRIVAGYCVSCCCVFCCTHNMQEGARSGDCKEWGLQGVGTARSGDCKEWGLQGVGTARSSHDMQQ